MARLLGTTTAETSAEIQIHKTFTEIRKARVNTAESVKSKKIA